MPRKIWTMWFGERFVRASVLTASPVPPFPQEGNQAYRSGWSNSALSLDHQGTRTPVCTPHTECPEYFTHTHTLGLTSRAPSGNASLLKGLLAEDQMEADFLQAGTESLR